MINDVGSAAGTSQLQTVTRLRDAFRIGHRLTRTYSELRTHGRQGQLIAAGAYPLMWLAYFGITCIQANGTVHRGVASLMVPNPISRPSRRLWRGLVVVLVLAVGVVQLLTYTPPALRYGLYVAGGLCVLAWAAELAMSWRISRQAGSLKATEKRVQAMASGTVVRGGIFAAWPQHSGQFGQLLDEVLDELQRDGISLLVQARDVGLADTYVRHGGTRPNPAQPCHVAWPVY